MTTARREVPKDPFKPPKKVNVATSADGSVWMQFEVITPQIAHAYLQKNHNNRSLSKFLAATYGADMAAGKWLLNNNGIGFDKNDALIDGQHRLVSIMETGVSQELPVFYGLEPQSRATIDIGRKRSVADELRMRGVSNTSVIASTVRLRLQYESKTIGISQTFRYSNAELIEWAELWENDLQDAITKGKMVNHAIKVAPTTLSACYAIFHAIDPDMTEMFFDKLATGENMVKGNPIHTLREKCMSNKHPSRGKLTQPQTFWMIVRCWNASRKGEQLHKIQLPEVVTGKNMIEAQ